MPTQTGRLVPLLIGLTVLLVPPTSASVRPSALGGTQLWTARFNDPLNGSDGGSDLAVAPDGTRVYVTGWVPGPGGLDFWTTAYAAATGRRLWTARWDDGGYDVASAIALSQDGSRLYVSGRAGLGGYDF